jgi:cobalt-zinc-cadmium efflux system outer membrane protein
MFQQISLSRAKKTIVSRLFRLTLCLNFLFGLSYAVIPIQKTYADDGQSISLSEAINLEEAIKLTLNKHPELKAYQFRLMEQQGKVTQAKLSPKPVVSLMIEDAIGTGELGALDQAQTTLSVSWILDKRIKASRTYVANQGINVIEGEMAIKKLDVASQTAKYFIDVLAYQENTKIVTRAAQLATETVEELKKRVDVGQSPLAELYRAEAELSKRKLDIDDVKHELANAIQQLAAQWGSTIPNFKSVLGSFDAIPKLVSFGVLRREIRNNPNIKKYASIDRLKNAELKLAEEAAKSKWKFTSGLRRNERNNTFGLVAGVSIPFGGPNKNQGRISQAKAKISQNRVEEEATRINIETALFTVYQQLVHSIHQSEVLRTEVLPKFNLALTETRKAYEQGKYSYLEWLAVQNELIDAQTELLRAKLSIHYNKIELERLTGTQITSQF